MDSRLLVIISLLSLTCARSQRSLSGGERLRNLLRSSRSGVAPVRAVSGNEMEGMDVNLQRIRATLAKMDADFARSTSSQRSIETRLKATTSAPQSFLRSLCLTPRGMFPHPLDCHKYVDCWDGRVLEKFCPSGLVFSDLPGGFCDFLEYVDCGERSTTTPQPPPVDPFDL